MKDSEFPKYVPPKKLQRIYFDWLSDKSTEWLDVAPKDWYQHMDLEILFDKYKEYSQANPDWDESFEEWLINDGESHYYHWCLASWKIERKFIR